MRPLILICAPASFTDTTKLPNGSHRSAGIEALIRSTTASSTLPSPGTSSTASPNTDTEFRSINLDPTNLVSPRIDAVITNRYFASTLPTNFDKHAGSPRQLASEL